MAYRNFFRFSAVLVLALVSGLGVGLALPWLAGVQGMAAEQNIPLVGPCYATHNNGTSVFESDNSSAVQQAVDAASPGGVVKVAGACVGVGAHAGLTQTVYISKPLILEGGHTHLDWALEPDPDTYPTTLDADRMGRVVVISGTVDVTLDSLFLTGGAAGDGTLDDYGGSIWSNSVYTLANSIVYSSTAVYGGGMYNLDTSPIISRVVFSVNRADKGGAVYNSGRYGASSPEMTGVTFISNTAAYNGGAVYNDAWYGASSPKLTGVIFSGNESGIVGGALHNNGDHGVSSPELTNILFSGNSAGIDGGAVYNSAKFGSSEPDITNVTFSGNSAGDEGGAIFNIGDQGNCSPKIFNSILWGNQAKDVSGTITATIHNFNASITLTHSLVEGAYAGGGGAWIGGDYQDGGGNIDQDPLFIDPISPTSAPTTTGDLRLGAGSPAIDAGDNDYVMDVPTDLDGEARVKDGDGDGDADVDMGAYEAKGYYDLTVTKSGAGSGSVTGTPAGIDCGGTCQDYLQEGTAVTLTAVPNGGSIFGGWGGPCGGEGDCQLTMDGEVSVTARFDLELPYEINLPLVKR